MHSYCGIDDGYYCAILKLDVGIELLPKMAHSGGGGGQKKPPFEGF